MRLSLLRIFSYIFLFAIVAGAYVLQSFPLETFFPGSRKNIQAVEADNTIIYLNALYEEHLAEQMAALEQQRRDLMQQLQESVAENPDEALLEEIRLLQEEQRQLRDEITTTQEEAEQFKEALETQVVTVPIETIAENTKANLEMERLSRELSGVRSELSDREEFLTNLNTELAQLRENSQEREGQLLSEIEALNLESAALAAGADRKEGELITQIQSLEDQVAEGRRTSRLLNETMAEADRLSDELSSMKTRLDSQVASVRTLNRDLAQLQSELDAKVDTIRDMESKLADNEEDLREALVQEAGFNRRISDLSDELADSEAAVLKTQNELTTALEALKEAELAAREAKEAAVNSEVVDVAQYEVLQEEMESSVSALRSELAAVRESSSGLESIIANLFQASNIQGLFIGSGDGNVSMVLNEASADAVLESSHLSVYDGNSAEVSKIIVSRSGENYRYSVFPGYSEPLEGYWF